jgi:hypothetical protein
MIGVDIVTKKGISMIRNKARINRSLLKDMKGVAGGLYHLNAKSSVGYAFTPTATGKSIACGEFIFAGEDHSRYDFYFDFASMTVL